MILPADFKFSDGINKKTIQYFVLTKSNIELAIFLRNHKQKTVHIISVQLNILRFMHVCAHTGRV